jgi:hypothetical protein
MVDVFFIVYLVWFGWMEWNGMEMEWIVQDWM